MSQIVVNGFSEGMIKDLSELLRNNQSYDDAVDIRLNSNDSSSDHVVVNIKGNELAFNIPDIPNIITIEPVANTLPSSWTSSTSVVTSVNTFTGAAFSGTAADIDDFLDKIENSLKTDVAFSTLGLNVARIGRRIRVWSTTVEVQDFNPVSTYTITTLQQSQVDQTLIGWDSADNDIYLFSTNDTTPIGGVGAIWHLLLDRVTSAATITLKYSEALNFTTQNSIANPGGIETIHETPTQKRIYWTDRLNDLRTINIGDENVMATKVNNLNISVGLQLSKPVLERISDGGSLIVGHYEVAYALRTLGGGLTPYSYASNSIYIVDDAQSSTYYNYNGADSGTVTNQSFTVRFTGIDTSFEYMDVIVLRKESADGPATISKVAEIAITGETMSYTHTGNETTSDILESDFVRLTNLFNKCHTIAQKDNILFSANTEGKKFNINFDSRAYRFDNNGNHGLVDGSGNAISITNAQLLQSFELDETSDAINPDQTTYRYQSDGQTIGGQGPNVKYEFGYRSIVTDVRPDGTYAHSYRLPWRLVGTGTVELGDGTVYLEGENFTDMKSPYMNHVFRGYRRGETYRFFWVPVIKGVEGYAKWIADIKMPEIFEDFQVGFDIAAPEQTGKIFPLMSKYGQEWYTNQLGVKMQIDIPSDIADQIDGYRIKRVKLEPEERSIIAQGIAHMCLEDTTQSPPTYHPILSGQSGTEFTLNSNTADATSSTPIVDGQQYRLGQRIITFQSPDLLFGRPLDHRSGDKVKIVQGCATQYSTLPQESSGIPADNTVLWKLYWGAPVQEFSAYGPERTVREGETIGFDQDLLIDNIPFENRSRFISSIGGRRSRGTDTTVLTLDDGYEIFHWNDVAGSGISWSNIGLTQVTNEPAADKYLLNYTRNVSQYGGQTYAARAANTCINTGTEVILGDNLSHTFNVYGGDTFVNVFDCLKMTKNFDSNELTSGTNGNARWAVGLYYPCESFVNTDLREGYHLNGEQNSSGFFYADHPVADPEQFELDYGEDFKYNYVYSEQMDTQRSFPLPVNAEPDPVHPVRIWASATKVYGELTDSWRIFDSEKYIDIRGDLGEIRQLITNRDTLLAWQERGLGIASVNERSVLNDSEGKGIVIGKSGVLPRFDYISNTIGSWHQFGFATSPSSVMFFDAKDGGLYLYSQGALNDVSEGKMKAWLYENTRGQLLQTDGPLNNSPYRAGITATYDNRNKEFLVTVHDSDKGESGYTDRNFTLAYDDRYKRFISFRSYTPTMYINDGKNILSPSPINEGSLYRHDVGNRGVFYDNNPSTSSITIIPNGHPNISKVFDNIRWYSEVYDEDGNELSAETVSGVTIFNPYQTTPLKTVFKRLLREWKLAIAYEQTTKNRIRGHYCKEKFDFTNNNNKEFKLYYLTNNYRVFPK